MQLANAIYPLIEDAKPLEQALNQYAADYDQRWHQMMMNKLGLEDYQPDIDKSLIAELLDILSVIETDMTIFFRHLAQVDMQAENLTAVRQSCPT